MSHIREHYKAAIAEMTVFGRSEDLTISPISLRRKVTVALERELAFVLGMPRVVSVAPRWEYEKMLPLPVQEFREEIRIELEEDFNYFHASMVANILGLRCPHVTSATISEIAWCIAHKYEETNWFLTMCTGELLTKPVETSQRRVP